MIYKCLELGTTWDQWGKNRPNQNQTKTHKQNKKHPNKQLWSLQTGLLNDFPVL